MELLTQNLPSGYNYKFPSITIKPMFFAQILEYLENVPKNPVEKFYFDYKVVEADDPKVDQLLLSDLDFVIFMKKGLTIADDVSFKSSVTCPQCGAQVPFHFKLSDTRFEKLDTQLLEGIKVNFAGDVHTIRMPKVFEFLNIFQNYRRYKKVSDMRLIKLIALFEQAYSYQQLVESLVLNATYEDISMLTLLDQLYYSSVKPISATCSNCINQGYSNQRGMEIGIEDLISDFFRIIIENNRLDESKIIFGEVRPNS